MALHNIALENSHGITVAKVENVTDLALVPVARKVWDQARFFASPVLFVDGRGYTTVAEFLQVCRTINEFSVNAGGERIFSHV